MTSRPSTRRCARVAKAVSNSLLWRPATHPAHRQVHRNGARPIQGFLEELTMAGQDSSRSTEDPPFEESDAPYRTDHSPAGGRILRGVRSLGLTAASAASISRLFGLGGSSAGAAVASRAVGSIVPPISLTERPACAASEVSMYSIMASSCSS